MSSDAEKTEIENFIENYCPICKKMTTEFLRTHIQKHYDVKDDVKTKEKYPDYVNRKFAEMVAKENQKAKSDVERVGGLEAQANIAKMERLGL